MLTPWHKITLSSYNPRLSPIYKTLEFLKLQDIYIV